MFNPSVLVTTPPRFSQAISSHNYNHFCAGTSYPGLYIVWKIPDVHCESGVSNSLTGPENFVGALLIWHVHCMYSTCGTSIYHCFILTNWFSQGREIMKLLLSMSNQGANYVYFFYKAQTADQVSCSSRMFFKVSLTSSCTQHRSPVPPKILLWVSMFCLLFDASPTLYWTENREAPIPFEFSMFPLLVYVSHE